MELEAIKLELANLEKREKTITQEATQKEVEQLKQQVLFLLQVCCVGCRLLTGSCCRL